MKCDLLLLHYVNENYKLNFSGNIVVHQRYYVSKAKWWLWSCKALGLLWDWGERREETDYTSLKAELNVYQ